MKKSSGAFPSGEQDWRAESDHRTMMDAGEIQADTGRMRGVQKHHRKMNKKMALVQRQMTSKR